MVKMGALSSIFKKNSGKTNNNIVNNSNNNVSESDTVCYSDTVKSVKKALLIGINYTGTSNQLGGCINDTENLETFLINNEYFNKNEIIRMTDKRKKTLYPTKKNILKKFDELVAFANEHKNEKVRMFLSYSGHGTYVADKNGDEEDGYDEALCPVDCDKNGYITDDVIKAKLIDRLGSNVEIVIFIDACHSGTMLDLKYNYKGKNLKDLRFYDIPETKCDVIMVSGCLDNQTSADAYILDTGDKRFEFQGAMTASLIANYKESINYDTLLKNMRTWLKKHKYTQIPQLSSGKKININEQFLLNNYYF